MADTTNRTDDLAVRQYGATDPRASKGDGSAADHAADNQPEAPDPPRLTPQGHSFGTASGEDSTDPQGGAKEGQSDPAEG
ncbi:hypothetical protein [Methylobacterium sp. Leaf118]|uniref:hypothetical protein n=1 Tax=Methylobacterium sp. Leaf118 TaxID=2876562 RepID=UPI001E5D082F|nr:hypothetical protein [Methylobacterium sp. Leaf118]